MRTPTVRGTRLRFPEANQAAPFIFQVEGVEGSSSKGSCGGVPNNRHWQALLAERETLARLRSEHDRGTSMGSVPTNKHYKVTDKLLRIPLASGFAAVG